MVPKKLYVLYMCGFWFLVVVIPSEIFSQGLSVQTSGASTGTVSIKMRGMLSDVGVMRVALYSERNEFLSEKPMFGGTAGIQHHEATLDFHHVPFGFYAVSVFHDENANAKLDVNIFGPIERYGFSNGARGIIGPPSFDKAKAFFNEPHKIYIVEVK